MTAGHVITDTAGQYYSAIVVHLAGGKSTFAHPVPMTIEGVGEDYALLKIDGESNLPFLQLGSFRDAEIGSDATIIGFPFSAISTQGSISQKFCIAANITANATEANPVSVQRITAKGSIPSQQNVLVDVVYFQGPSVKGISGSPIISDDTGNVIGIVTQKLIGITKELGAERATIDAIGRGSMVLTDSLGRKLDPNAVIGDVINTLDTQLANGYGAATGIDRPAIVLARIKQGQKK